MYLLLRKMSVYKIEYELKDKKGKHYRFYNALDRQTAEEMFKETVGSGGLIGESPKITKVEKKNFKK